MSDQDPRVRELTYRLMEMAPDAPPFPEEAPMQVPEKKQRPPMLVWAATAVAALLLVGVPLFLFRGGDETPDPATTVAAPDTTTTTEPGETTTSEPGTTRDWVSHHVSLNGLPIVLIDTAGHREAADALEAEAIERAIEQSHHADAQLVVIDGAGVSIRTIGRPFNET